ncbi:MAG: transcriptional repressor NrdR [Candidatus Nanohaloarchaeota archaeon]|nr:transcriptional repressor NrdR [Candidatus Nanohaloarchaeota archaeon]
MRCPFCGHEETRVIDSRYTDDMKVIRRRRVCEECGKRFTTYERADLNILVIKRDGRREEFRIEKIIEGIKKATQKRPVSLEEIEKIAESVEQDLRDRNLKEIPSEDIGREVMRRLKSLDSVAYVRFASVYMRFNDLEEFKRIIEEAEKEN